MYDDKTFDIKLIRGKVMPTKSYYLDLQPEPENLFRAILTLQNF